MYRNFKPDPRQEAAAKRLESVLGEGYWSLLEYLQSGLDPDVAELVAHRIILATAEERQRSRFRLYVPRESIKELSKAYSPTRKARLILDAMTEYLGEHPTLDDFLAQCRTEGVSEACALSVHGRRK
jgi:hypothetical protein